MSANRIALLRGINIGPRQRVKMPELRELIEGLGYTDVQTLVQSGNVVFTARAKPATLEKKLEQEIEKQLGVDPQGRGPHARRARRRDRGQPVRGAEEPEGPPRHVPVGQAGQGRA